MISDELLRDKLNKSLREDKSPDDQYREYLNNHINGVRDVYENIIKPVLVDNDIDESTMKEISSLIAVHDQHKYSVEEWDAYRDHFYDPDNNPRSNSEAFNYAWNHHQKKSPHHWQYWCLINDVDEPQIQPMDIPFKYIVEMLCDWQSAGNHYGNTAYDWYEKQKDKMIFTDHTRKIVEKYIVHFK